MSKFSVDDLLKELDDLPQHLAAPSQRCTSVPVTAPSTSTPAHMETRTRLQLDSTSQPARSSQQGTSYSAAPLRPMPSPPQGTSTSVSARSKSLAVVARSSLDDLFDDIGIVPSSTNTAAAATAYRAASSISLRQRDSLSGVGTVSSPRRPMSKCMGLFLGGPQRQRGRNGSSVGTVVCCDSLRCTKCDFKVIWFQGKQWDSAVDYLFFRNNFPTESKLAPMLLAMPDSCAYSCQCSWHSATQDKVVDFGGDLRWVCAGHS